VGVRIFTYHRYDIRSMQGDDDDIMSISFAELNESTDRIAKIVKHEVSILIIIS